VHSAWKRRARAMQSQFTHLANGDQLGKRNVWKSGTSEYGGKKGRNHTFKLGSVSKLKLHDENSMGMENGLGTVVATE
jgi:hypothetical protein